LAGWNVPTSCLPCSDFPRWPSKPDASSNVRNGWKPDAVNRIGRRFSPRGPLGVVDLGYDLVEARDSGADVTSSIRRYVPR